MPSKVRAVWTGTLNGVYSIFVLSGGDVYFINYDDGELSKIATIGNSKKHATFFYYQLSLFLIDGNNIYTVTEKAVRASVGYAPLIGKDWHEEEIGEINEPRNILTSRARIRYLITKSTASMLYTDGAISSIDAVFVNGVLLSADRYMLSSTPGIVIVTGLQQGDRVELYFTYASALSDSDIKSNTHAAVFGGISNSRPFLYGGRDGSVMYSGAYVSGSALADSKRVYTDSDAIYFPLGYEFTVGDGRYPVRAVGRHFDRLLIFTEGGVWMADSSACDTEDFPLMSINTSVSTKSYRSVAIMGNSPCTVGVDGVYVYSSNTDELDECNAYCISKSIKALITKEFLKNSGLYYWQKKDELFFYSEDEEMIWVYSPSLSVWTRYTGICAQGFFDIDGNAAFYNEKNIFVFYDTLVKDEATREIHAKIISHPEDFSTSKKKRLSYVTAEFSDGEITVELYSDNKSILRGDLTFDVDSSQSTLQKKRVRADRFASVTVSLLANGTSRQRIIAARLNVK